MAIAVRCDHIKDNGVRCGSPALRGRTLCYFHDRQMRGSAIRTNHPCYIIPELHTARDIQTATTRILHAFYEGQFTRDTTITLLHGLQIARAAMKDRK